MKRVERPKIEQLSTGGQFHLVDMKLFEVIEGKNEPSSIRFEVPDTDMNKRVYPYVEDRNLLIFEGQCYIILVNHLDELGFKDCDAIQIGAELSLQTQEKKVTGYFSIEEGLAHTFEGSNFKYINRCSKQIQLQFDNFGGESRMKMIRKLLDRFDIECFFDNMTVVFADRIGKTTDKLYKFGYNVNAIKKTTDDSNCSFSVLLLGHTPSKEEGEGPQFTYYYESPLKYKMPELIRYRQADNIEDDKIKNKETALEKCKVAVNDIPVVSITVDHKEANFDDSNEPKVGDRAILQHYKYNMDFDVRVVKRTRYPYEETPNVYEFSNKREELVDRTEEQKKWTADILSVVKELDQKLLEQSNNYTDRINEITDKKAEAAKQESEAAKKLAELVKENQKNFQTTIIESNTEPTTNLDPGKTLWLDTSKGKPGVLKKWNGKTWDVIVPDVEGAIKASEEKTNKEIQQIISDMEGLADKDWLNEQLKDKADKSGVYTKEESNKKLEGFASKQIYETDQKGSIKKFEDIGTKFTQTDEAIKQMATKQSVTDLGNNVTQVSKTANEAKQTSEGNTRTISDIKTTVDDQKNVVGNLSKKTTEIEEKAGQITEKLMSVEQKFDNIKVGGRNLLSDTESWNTTQIASNSAYGIFKNNLNELFGKLVGKTVTFSFDVKIDTTDGSAGRVQLYCTNGNPKYIFPTKIFTGITNTFQRITYTTTISENASNTGQAQIELWGWDSKTTKIYLRNFKLETGNIATDWTPAPEEQVSQVVFEQKTAELTRTTESIKQSVESVTKTQTTQGEQIKQAQATLVTQAEAIKAKVTITEVGNYVEKFDIPSLKNTVIKNREEYLKQLAEKVATADYNKKTEQIDREISATKEGISLTAKKTEVYTRVEADGRYAKDAYVKEMEARISVTEKSILSTVKVGNIISSINQTAEKIQIEAKRINLVGAVTAESIAGKLLEGITIRAIDPNNSNNFTEMSNGRIFTQGFQTPAEWNRWAKRVVTGLEKGLFYSKGYKEDGSLANSIDIASWGLNLNDGNDTAHYGAQAFTVLDNGQRKSVTAKSYDSTLGWKPSLTLDNPQNAEFAKITSNALYFYNMKKNYKNEWITEDIGSHITLYKSMVCCDDHWNGYLQVKSSDGSRHSGVVATEYKTTSQRKLKTYIKDLQFDALQSVLDLKIKEYYFKNDIAKLYEMRANKEGGQAPYTLKDIPKRYGFMVDDCPLPFTDEQRNGANLYGSLSVTIRGFQQYVHKTDDRLDKIEKVIIDENNSKHRNVRKSGGRTAKRSHAREKHLSGSRNRTRSTKPKVKRRKREVETKVC
ncbi:phage tail protein [Bacillus sp. JJ864]|uniref:phage tail protein n=1 Tax=Bacillus sp. JJ864 TaxID=3122975 RepID=UPI002FFDCAB1